MEYGDELSLKFGKLFEGTIEEAQCPLRTRLRQSETSSGCRSYRRESRSSSPRKDFERKGRVVNFNFRMFCGLRVRAQEFKPISARRHDGTPNKLANRGSELDSFIKFL